MEPPSKPAIGTKKTKKTSAADVDGAPDVSEVIDRLGCGWAQLIICCVAGGCWLADGAAILITTSVARSVGVEWGLNPAQRGLIVSLVFSGMLVGAIFSGPLSDWVGRRNPILVSYIFLGVLSCLSAWTTSILWLGVLRFGVGVVMQLGQPACIALMSESSPTEWRLLVNGAGGALFIVGEIFSVALLWWQDSELKHLDWRWLLCMGSIPSFVLFAIGIVVLWESPYFLALRGDHQGVQTVLARIRKLNGNPPVDISYFKVAPKLQTSSWDAVSQGLQTVFVGKMLPTTMILSFACFCTNFGWYGARYAFPQIIPELNMGSSPAMAILVGILWEIPGYILGIVLSGRIGRRGALFMGWSVLAISAAAFTWAGAQTGESRNTLSEYVLYAGYSGLTAMWGMTSTILYPYASELYPAKVRATGVASCLASGRIGSALSALCYEWMHYMTGMWESFFCLLGVLSITNVAFILLLPETQGVPLKLEEHNGKGSLSEGSPLLWQGDATAA